MCLHIGMDRHRIGQPVESSMGFRAKDSLAEQIAQHLAEQIVRGDLLEGERIQELRIAKELKVSRGSVREALLLLEQRHLIEIYARRGAIVSELTVQHVRALYELFALLVGRLLRHVLQRGQANAVEVLQLQLQRIREALVAGPEEVFADEVFAFVRLGYRWADNAYLEDVVDDLEPALRRCTFLILHGGQRAGEALYEGLRQICELIESGDEVQAVQRAEDMVQGQCEQVVDALLRMKQVELAWAQRHRR